MAVAANAAEPVCWTQVFTSGDQDLPLQMTCDQVTTQAHYNNYIIFSKMYTDCLITAKINYMTNTINRS